MDIGLEVRETMLDERSTVVRGSRRRSAPVNAAEVLAHDQHIDALERLRRSGDAREAEAAWIGLTLMKSPSRRRRS